MNLAKLCKRAAVLFLVLGMVASATACTGGNAPETPSNGTPTSEGGAGGQEADTPDSPAEGDTNLRFSWWGNQTRNDLTQQAIDLYVANNPGITIEPEFLEFSAYWEKLATQAAANSLPDVMQMNENQIAQYYSKDQLLDMKPYIDSGALDTTNIPMALFDETTHDGGIYGISGGSNCLVLIYDPAPFEEAGITFDDNTWTWDDYEDVMTRLYEATGKQADIILHGDSANSFLRHYGRNYGHDMYSADKKSVAVTSDDEFLPIFEMSYRMVQSGVFPSPDAYLGEVSGDDLLSKGTTASRLRWTNQLIAAVENAGRDLEMALLPTPAGATNTPHFIRGSMHFSVSASSQYAGEGIAFVNFISNDEGCNDILQGERGVPISSAIRASLSPNLNETVLKTFDMVDRVSTMGESMPIIYPTDTNEADLYLQDVLEQMYYDALSPQEALESYLREAGTILSRNN